MRSLATSKSRSSSSAYSSRTLPLPTCRAASGMNRFLLSDEGVQAVEHGVDVTDGRVEVEDGVEVDARGKRAVAADELGEVRLFVPGAHRMRLHSAVRLVARETGLDEGEKQPVAEEEAVAHFEVASHPLGVHDEAVDDPAEAVEHVIECEKRVRDDDALGGGLRDVALVPERDVLHPDERVRSNDAREPADALGDLRIPFVRHRRRALHAFCEWLLDLAHLGACEVPDLRRKPLE